jgi:serine/threonine-protein kinase
MARFEREAQMTASLSSLHTVRLYDFGMTDEGTFFYAMELLDGMDLERLVQAEGPLRPERAVHFLIQACRSLAEAHELGLVHRDIKPANLFVCRQGREFDVLKVVDFGLVRPDPSIPSDATLLTGDAVVIGTPAYMAPEHATGGKVGPQSDLYSLGCVAYWLLTGRTVFDGKSPVDIIMRHVHHVPAPLRSGAGVDVPAALESAVLSCLAKDPGGRPPNAETLGRMLAAIPFERPWTPERARDSWAELLVR